MTDELPPTSETAIGMEIFRPLWALVTVGAVTSAHAAGRGEFSLTDYVASRRADLDRLLDAARLIGGISSGTLDIADAQGGWSDGSVTSITEVDAELLMYAGFVEEYPADVHDAVVLGRLLSAATDLQLATMMDGLVGAAAATGADPAVSAPQIVDAIRAASALSHAAGAPSPAAVFRMWRVAFAPQALRPDSLTPKPVQAALRRCLHALEETVIA